MLVMNFGYQPFYHICRLPRWLSGREFAYWCRRRRRRRFDLWIGKIPWRRKWQPFSVFLPGKSHGQRSRQATVHGVTKNQTWLRMHAHYIYALQTLLLKPLDIHVQKNNFYSSLTKNLKKCVISLNGKLEAVNYLQKIIAENFC